MDSKKAEPGSVSWGTMRPEDLIPKFLEKLEKLDAKAAAEVTFYYKLSYEKEIANWAGPFDPEELGDWDTWAKSHPEDAMWLLEELFEALNECAPDGHYFGASEGDGSDYGFWPFEVEDACLLMEEQAKTGR